MTAGHLIILVGGVGELYQGDHDLGRRAVERLAGEQLGPHVLVEELHYGAVAVAQRLQDLRPHALVLVGAAARGREPGTVERRRILPPSLSKEELWAAVGEAVTGYVTVDLVVEVGIALGALPPRIVAVEVEPAIGGPNEDLSPEGQAALGEVLELVRTEVRRAPLFELSDRIRALLSTDRLEPTAAVDALRGLLGELEAVDATGRWGRTFALRDALRSRIADGDTGEGMDHLDWGLWWSLIEELDGLQREDAGAV